MPNSEFSFPDSDAVDLKGDVGAKKQMFYGRNSTFDLGGPRGSYDGSSFGSDLSFKSEDGAHKLGGSAARNALVESEFIMRRGVTLLQLLAAFIIAICVVIFFVSMLARHGCAVVGGLVMILSAAQVILCEYTSKAMVQMLGLFGFAHLPSDQIRKKQKEYEVVMGHRSAGLDPSWFLERLHNVLPELRQKLRLNTLVIPAIAVFIALIGFIVIAAIGPDTAKNILKVTGCTHVEFILDVRGKCCKRQYAVKNNGTECLEECPTEEREDGQVYYMNAELACLHSRNEKRGRSPGISEDTECWCDEGRRRTRKLLPWESEDFLSVSGEGVPIPRRNSDSLFLEGSPINPVPSSDRYLEGGGDSKALVQIEDASDYGKQRTPHMGRNLNIVQEQKKEDDRVASKFTWQWVCAFIIFVITVGWLVVSYYIVELVLVEALNDSLIPFLEPYVELLSWQLKVNPETFSANDPRADRRKLMSLPTQSVNVQEVCGTKNRMNAYDWDKDSKASAKTGKTGKTAKTADAESRKSAKKGKKKK